MHFHLVPRMPDWPPDLVGPRVFDLLRRPESEHVTPARMDELAWAIGARLQNRT